ncbi:hypothetical protein [Alicyclobacillus sp. ALC3]|uniref:hypothetical protein n=1 Tax=Alicyclobacillus sp. ALC3 TaxID=2796143 RepID=UPI002379A4D9|nr:hypothetical protein [Alicyclobacillus sp. ALC3]WDL96103.1 hypothetical protein JC200_17435 [Alicyclobacillus sp. ALC3]
MPIVSLRERKDDLGISADMVSLPVRLSIESVWMAFAGLSELFLGLQIWDASTRVPYTNIMSVVVIAGGLALSVLSLTATKQRTHRQIEVLVVILFVGAVSAWVYSQIYGNPSYGTDELAFDQYSAQLLLHHINPYTVSLAPAFSEFQVPIIFHTFTLTGGTVAQLSYPAMSFLFYVPLLAMGIHAQAAVYVDVFFWLVTSLLMYLMLPRPHKALGLVLGMSFMYMSYVVGGVTDALFLPFLLLAAWRWDKFADKKAGWMRWLGPIGLGIAMSIKQTAWFLAPFVAVAIWKETRSSRTVIKYVAVTAAAFFSTNLPFMVANFHDWFSGIMSPLVADTIPSGQGLINLSLMEHTGGGHLSYYSDSAMALLFAFLVSLYLNYRGYKRLVFILPSLVLFFPTRSFATYLIDLFPIMVVSALSISVVPRESRTNFKAWTGWARVLAFVPFGFLTILALITPGPLRMKIVGVHTTGELQTIDKLRVVVENRTNRPQTPHFTLTVSPQLTSFWQVDTGPKTLAAGQVATYVLDAPNVPSMPSITGGFLLDAFTTGPATLSTSRVYRANKWRAMILPEAVDHAVPVHRKITLTVQLYDQLGRKVKKSGVHVYLGQIVYDQSGLFAGEASINGQVEGKSPVSALTNVQGLAKFTVVEMQLQSSPVYFQAFVQPRGEYPSGYSQIISIRFSKG